MQIKRFEAATMTEALREVKKEFGSNAVILSARSQRPESGLLGYFNKKGVVVTAAIDNQNHNKATSVSKIKTDGLGKQLNGGMAQIKRYADKAISNYASPNAVQSIEHDRLRRQWLEDLLQQGIEKKWADKIVAFISQDAAHSTANTVVSETSPLAEALHHLGLKTQNLLASQSRKRVIFLVGPNGSGKTTTLVKLAAHFSLKNNQKVGIVTLDNERIGAWEQIKLFGQVLALPVETANTRAELKKALKAFRSMDVVLVDTPGTNHRESADIERLQRFVTKRDKYLFQLVVNASTRMHDLTAIHQQLEWLPLNGIIFTKIDETDRNGNIINLGLGANLPLTCLSNGRQVPDDLLEADVNSVAGIIGRSNTHHANQTFSEDTIATVSLRSTEPKVSPEHFVANQNSDIFHRAGCKWTGMIKETNCIVFESGIEAVERGYKPCRYCRPQQIDGVEFRPTRRVLRQANGY